MIAEIPSLGRFAIQSQMDRICAIYLPKTITNKPLVWIKPLSLSGFVISPDRIADLFQRKAFFILWSHGRQYPRLCFCGRYAGRTLGLCERQTARPSAPRSSVSASKG